MAACSIDLILNAEVSGTTSTNIGSARIITGSNTQASFRAMMGTSTTATASVEVRRFTGATSILKLNTAGIGLQDVSGSQRTIGDSAVTGSWVTGSVGDYALEFVGASSNYVTTPSAAAFPTGPGMTGTGSSFTVSAWITQTEPGDSWEVIAMRGAATNNWAQGWGLSRDNGSKITFWVGDYRNDSATATWSTTNTWAHVVGVYTSGAVSPVQLYFDGSARTAVALTNGGADGGGELNLGYETETDGADNYWDGKIDEFAIWNVPLSASDITSLYNSGNGVKASSISSSNLTVYYDMEGGPGASILTDRTGNGYNGTLTNMLTGSLLLVDDWYDFYASGSAADVSTLVKGIRVILQ